MNGTEQVNKIIFLDIDGVLCFYPPKHLDYRINANSDLSPLACKHLKTILDKTGARIVISSSWRLNDVYLQDLLGQLGQHGITRDLVVGVTDNLMAAPGIKDHCHLRWMEINDYIKKHNIKKYVVLDDFALDRYTDKNFVKTQMHTGLTEELRNEAIKRLD